MFTWLGLLEASVVGGICIILFFLVSQLFGERYRASYRKVIWLLIALRMCIPVSLSLFPKPVTVQVPIYVMGARSSVPMAEGINIGHAEGPQSPEESQAGKEIATGEENKGAAGTAVIRQQFTSQDILVILWGCGSVGVLLYYLLVHIIFCHKMRDKSQECADERILAITAKTAGEMGLKNIPQVRLTKGAQTGPFTVGFLHNIVFLPDTDYQEKDLQYIIRHELAHCAGKDTQMKVLFVIINAIHWFNPFVWFMKSLVDQDMELACDERVLADTSREERSEYGEVLMSCIGTDRTGRSVLSTGYVQGVKFIKRRFRNIFNMQKKSGKAAGCIMIALLIMVSAGIGFEAGRTVYAKSGIAIDCGIELRTDVTGDGLPDRVRVYDNNDVLRTSVNLNTVNGQAAQFDYDEELWAESYLVSGDLSGNGVADIVLMRISFGMHLTGPVSVLYVAEESGKFIWKEYPEVFIPNPVIDMEQPETFDDIECLGATVIEEDGRHYLRLIALDMVVFDDDTVQCIDCLLQEDGWFIKDMRTITGYISENKESELLKNNVFAYGKEFAPEEKDSVLSSAAEDNGSSDDVEVIGEIVADFCGAYFRGDADSLRQYLVESYEGDVDVFEGPADGVERFTIKGLEDARGKKADDIWEVSVEYTVPGEDSYTYLTIGLVRTETGWKVKWYGIEK